PERTEPAAANPAPGTQHTAPGTGDPSPRTEHSAPGTLNPARHLAHVHDAPPAMAFALVVLAIGSVLAGYAGIGGRFEHFLEPSFSGRVVQDTADGGGEWALVVVSVLAAAGGILAATYCFLKDRTAADAIAARFAGLYRTLLNKYYVDEIYDATIV